MGEIKETKIEIILYLIYGIVNLLIYSEIFGNINKYGGVWLCTSVVAFCMFVIKGVKLEILRNK